MWAVAESSEKLRRSARESDAERILARELSVAAEMRLRGDGEGCRCSRSAEAMRRKRWQEAKPHDLGEQNKVRAAEQIQPAD